MIKLTEKDIELKPHLKCCVCGKNLPEKFHFILVHNATREDVEQGAYPDTKKELFCCNDCGDNLNFRKYKDE